MLAPVLSQLPVFVLTTAVLAKLSQPPTPFDSESFLTLTTLAHADPTTTFPIVLGIITMANVESSRWMMSEEEQEREKKVNQWSAEKRAQGHRIVEPKKHLQSALRLLSVGRILLGALVPGVRSSFIDLECHSYYYPYETRALCYTGSLLRHLA
jgi:inner membrane protein COX18